MKRKDLTTAGWLFLVQAGVLLPLVVLLIVAGKNHSFTVLLWKTAMTAAMTALTVILLLSWKRALNALFSFREADGIIDLAIAVGVASAILGFLQNLAHSMGSQTSVFVILNIVSVIADGVLLVMFGRVLTRLAGVPVLQGLLYPYCFLTIAFGVSMVTIILLPLGLVLAFARSIVAALIFFRLSETQEGPNSGLQMV